MYGGVFQSLELRIVRVAVVESLDTRCCSPKYLNVRCLVREYTFHAWPRHVSFIICRSRFVRRQFGRDFTVRPVSALALSRLDCCNAILAGLPMTTFATLQRVLNTAARIVRDNATGQPSDLSARCQNQAQTLPVGSQAPRYTADLKSSR